MDDGRTLAELSHETGVPSRTIRFYISRGLVEGPLKAGRGALYTPAHADRIRRILELQSQGRTLAEISRLLTRSKSPDALPEPSPWWQHTIADDIVVWVRANVSPWRASAIRQALSEFSSRLAGDATTRRNDE
jgi:DNA-binding transcriptional MerR regulator